MDHEDLVRVRFNSGKVFASKVTGLSIVPGTELFVRIAQQVESSVISSLEALFTIFIILTVIMVLTMIAISFFSGIEYVLPIWVFIN